MTRLVRRWVWLAVLLCPVAVFAQNRRTLDDQPNAETLRRLAEQLAKGNPQNPQNIDPELLKLAQEYLKKNPDILKDPKFQEQVQQWQQQAKNNPNELAKQFQQQNPNITPEQLQELKSKFQQSNPGGFTPPPNITPPRPTTANTGGQRPPIDTQPTSPTQPNNQGQPWQPSIPPGQQNPWQPNGQSNPWKSAENKAQAKQEYQQVVGMWENNFGSIDKTPSLKGALIDMFSGDGKSPLDGSAGNGNPLNGGNGMKPGQQQKPWWDTSNNPNGGNQGGFVGWLKNTSANPPSWWKNMTGNWNKPSVQPPNMNPGNGWTAPQYSGGGFNPGGISGSDLGSGALPIVIVVVVIVAAVAGFLIWRYWPQIQAKLKQPKPIPGLGPWTIDPRQVVDRETLVRAFEYLSVLICGDGARVWNHMTIADAFRENVPGAAPFADPLARLYALARYSPANELIDAADIAEARGYLCRLAGVQA